MHFFNDKEWENWFSSTWGRSKKNLKKNEKIIDHVSTAYHLNPKPLFVWRTFFSKMGHPIVHLAAR